MGMRSLIHKNISSLWVAYFWNSLRMTYQQFFREKILKNWVRASSSGDNSEEDTPVPIPNTEVKLFCADDTWRVTARESRTPPDKTAGKFANLPEIIGCSEVAQWWSNRLLTGRPWVRAPPSESV